MKAYRLFIYNTIKTVIHETFNHEGGEELALMEVFGSVRQKLALDTSDIDIVITGVDCDGSDEERHSNLEKFVAKLQEAVPPSYMCSCEFISTASIPLIKIVSSIS